VLYAREDWSVLLINPGSQDKVTRAHQVQPLFEAGMIYAPVPVDGRDAYTWAEGVKNECATFPKGKHDDRVDSTTQAISWLRNSGILQMDTEAQFDIDQSITHRGRPLDPIYPA
jgi:phage terminase large subunit-like protein